MILCRLQVVGVRILRDAHLEPVAGLNVLAGENGAGKTSLLEAIHLLATGRSFRTRQLAPVLAHGASVLQVTGSIQGPRDPAPYPVGIRRSARETAVRIRGQQVAGLAEVARLMPVQVVHPDSHLLVSGPPAQRRAFLDWGAFHREGGFHGVWQRYRRLLQQRNAALRSGGDVRAVRAWDEALAAAGQQLDDLRRGYLGVLREALADLNREWPTQGVLGCEYRRGWSSGVSLGEALERDEARDRRAGFTHAGPHRAEVIWKLDDRVAGEVASRGQQKALVLRLKLAQARVLRAEAGVAPMMLVDDLPSELDTGHREQMMGLLRALQAQVFVTTIDAGAVQTQAWPVSRMFHVEHGRITPAD